MVLTIPLKTYWLAIVVATMLSQLSACGSASIADTEPVEEREVGVPEQQIVDNDGCEQSENLLRDLVFADAEAWRYTQHAGQRSFSVAVQAGELEMTRIGVEPWMVIQQRVSLSGRKGGILRFSADLRGAVTTEPLIHAFPHIAGLYLQSGARASEANAADHHPNYGEWDWQSFEVSVPRGPADTYALVGFSHQGGGSLWARNPSLVLVDCQAQK